MSVTRQPDDTNKRLVVVSDFDGTVTRRDVGYWMFHHFSGGRTEELIPDWKAGTMTSRECLTREAEMAPIPDGELHPFLDSFEIDRTFVAFVECCTRQAIPLQIVSDGLDIYIKYLLERNGLGHLPVSCNEAAFDGPYAQLTFPHENGDCQRCGNCKGERIRDLRRQSADDLYVVFIGDGYSDICALGVADLVFAKKDLEKYCRSHNIDYCPYRTFADVSRQLETRGLVHC